MKVTIKPIINTDKLTVILEQEILILTRGKNLYPAIKKLPKSYT
jgi:hypothetical protein